MIFSFLLSILIITIAHVVRIYRWALFINVYENPKTERLLKSLSFGYLLSFLLPFKLGDLFRAWFSGKKMQSGKALGFSTVIIDRYLDVIVVGLIFAIFTVSGRFGNEMLRSLVFYISLAGGFIIVSMILAIFRGSVKKLLKAFAGIFNQQIELKILKFSWALIRNFKDITSKISRAKLISSTILMWILYLASYYFYAEFISMNGTKLQWSDVFLSLFTESSIQLGGFKQIFSFSTSTVFFMVYMILPNLILLVLSFIPFRSRETESQEEKINLLPHINQSERLNFLEMYFSNAHRSYIENYLRINQNILIVRDYSAGSNATTMLCMNGEKQFFRKYAFGADGDKLYEQVLWLSKFKSILPLPEIIQQGKEKDFCYYDMPYPSNSEGLFNYAHSMPLEDSWKIVSSALKKLESSLYKTNVRDADKETIEKYIESKVIKNIEKIKNGKFLKPLMKYDEIFINGKKFKNLPYFFQFFTEEKLYEIFRNDIYTEIHGDLTIENIICTKNQDGDDDFYIIDPNTGNVHDSPNLDYGKLLQSIHGGYEFLMATQNVDCNENRINFIFTKSEVYTKLWRKLDTFMTETFSPERVRSIYFHEIIHWFRLMPYKIEKNGNRSLLFYAGMIMVVNDVANKFGLLGESE